MKLQKRKGFLRLEKNLLSRYDKTTRTNEIILTKNDFTDGRLDGAAFVRLKEESWYIPYSEQVEIKLPAEYEQVYRNDVEKNIYRELYKVKQERMELSIRCIVLFLVGAITLALALFAPFIPDINWVFDMFVIVSWVFVWLGVQMWVLDRRELHHKRFTLLQLADAKVKLT